MTSVQEETGIEEGEQDEITPELEVETAPVIELPDEDKYPDATTIQTGENEYTLYVDCPDNSNAPELETLPANDTTGSISGAPFCGMSENLLIAVMTHGLQVDPMNAAQINFDAYMDKPVTINTKVFGTDTYVLTSNISAYGENVLTYTLEDLKYDAITAINSDMYELCVAYIVDSINNTNGNITCALTRYNMGPDAWDQAMQECIDATGLTAEEIYANYDSSYVLQYDSLGLGDPNYANEVLQYIGDEPITITEISDEGEAGDVISYYLKDYKEDLITDVIEMKLYNRRAELGEPGVRIQVSRSHSSPTERQAINHMTIEKAVEEGFLDDDFFEGIDNRDEMIRRVTVYQYVCADYEVFSKKLHTLDPIEQRVLKPYLLREKTMNDLARGD